MRDLLLMVVIFGSLPFILMRPYIGVLVWSWVSYMNPHRLAWGSAYDYPFAAVVGGTLLASLVFSREPKRIPWRPITVIWLMFILWMSLTTLFALIPDDAAASWTRMIKIQLITFVTLLVMGSKERINWLVTVIVISIGFYGVKGGIFTIATSGNYMVFGPPGSFIEGNNEIALALIMIIPLLYYLRLVYENKWIRLGLWGMIGLSALSVLGSYSRGAFLAGAAMLLFLVLKSQRKFLLALAMLIAIPLLMNFMPEEWFEKMETIKEYRQDESAQGRFNAWRFAFNLAKDRPLIGGGFESFDKELFLQYAPAPEDFHDAHSIYFEVLGEHGFVGLFLFVLLGFLALRIGKWVILNTRDRPDMAWANRLAAMLQVSLIGFAVGGAFLGLAYFDLYYHLVAIMVLLRAQVEKHLVVEYGDATADAGEPAMAQGIAVESGK